MTVIDHPLMIENTWKEWSITKTEIADGFYPPVCATTRMVLDHLAVGVVGSFCVVGIMHLILWHRFISGELGFRVWRPLTPSRPSYLGLRLQ